MARRSATRRAAAIRRAGPWIGGVLASALGGCAPVEPGDDGGITPDAIHAMPDAMLDVMPDVMRDIMDGIDRGRPADGGFDGMPDTGSDARPDATTDATTDAMADTMTDAMMDATNGAMLDGSTADAIAAADGPPPAPPDAGPGDREIVCDDGLDDDGDGAVDCHDGDCLDDAPCLLVPETPVQRIQELFNQRCGCHTGLVALGGLSLQAPFTDATVGVPATIDAGWLRIAPGDPAASLLYVKLTADVPPALGDRMPPEMPFLAPEQIELVGGWIGGIERSPGPSAGENRARGSP